MVKKFIRQQSRFVGERRRVAVLGLGQGNAHEAGADARSRGTALRTGNILILAVAVLAVVFVEVSGGVAGVVVGGTATRNGAVGEVISAVVGVGATRDLGKLGTDWDIGS